ncbi:HMGL-like protein [Bacteriovorax sp. BSW11_IV]|uniref:hydroxymethylglutaryl-CoA lyase n=1 Tax=Bacteriovorax sp. BSW11_IV TaxID=1353529 RepID=UPI00038A23A4|nr:hydroxymethylglutaryl-CoA lyase [Bacteriovorax sp. BSW11_IV]EQC50232.1 HMGL-like protein [Bacteriovorax sp. BSW11_IV]
MLKSLPTDVRIIEVGPRDGLQNEKKVLSTDDKAHYIKLLTQTGLKTIEVTSFVRADKIPQMGDAVSLFEKVKSFLPTDIHAPCLVPNLTGLETALDIGVKEIAVFTATSNTFNKKNINATIEESFERIRPVAKMAIDCGIKVRGYISTVFGCPYEGQTSIENLMKVTRFLDEIGCYEISLGDTIGVGNPAQVLAITNELKKEFKLDRFAMHMHDTNGMALANILTALDCGHTNFDSSSAGLGGCPYAKGATGNVATEDVVNLLHCLGVNTGVDMEKLTTASEFILSKLEKKSSSKFYNAYMARKANP